jgi:hypothetical protein
VTFPEYGNTEIVTLGDLDLPHHLQTEMNRTGYRQKDAQGQDFHTKGGSNAAYGREKDSFNTIGVCLYISKVREEAGMDEKKL